MYFPVPQWVIVSTACPACTVYKIEAAEKRGKKHKVVNLTPSFLLLGDATIAAAPPEKHQQSSAPS